MRDMGHSPAALLRIRLSMSYLEPSFEANGVDVRLHERTLYNSMSRFDDDLLVNTHAYSAVAATSPVLHLRRIASGRLFPHYMASFERVWEEAAPVADRRGSLRVVA
jgi:hypothetical protein